MRILLVNDDGISAPGLKVLERIAVSLAQEVYILAPEEEQSASSHSLTLHSPLRLRKLSAKKFAINGTPTDCIYIALHKIMKKNRPDLVLSGVNFGSNVGYDVTYSGTIAAAIEATLFGVPAMALSQTVNNPKDIYWQTAEEWGAKVIKSILAGDWKADTLININFPACKPSEVRGMKATSQGEQKMAGSLEERVDPRGRLYYWIGRDTSVDKSNSRNSDLAVLRRNYVSVTPLQLNLTHKASLRSLSKVLS